MTRNEYSARTVRRFVQPAVGAILEPQVDVLRDQTGTLHYGGAHADHEIPDPELLESR
jgi:hypothetical protein